MHVITTNTGRQIQIDWNTKAIFLFCKKEGINLSGFAEKMASLQFDLETLISLIQVSVVVTGQPEPDIDSVCQIIDECGGIFASEGPLADFLNYLLNRTILKTTNEETEEKKSQSTS